MKKIQLYSKKAYVLIQSSTVRDKYKEVLIPAYAVRIMWQSVKFLMMILVLIGCFYCFYWIFNYFGISLLSLILSIDGFMVSVLISCLYAFIRLKSC